MGLTVWNSGLDPYNSQQLAANFSVIEFHDHTAGRGLPIGTGALSDGAVTAPKIAAQQAWQALTLPAGWGSLFYFKDTLGIVHVRRDPVTSASTGATTSLALGTMPVGYRPGQTLTHIASIPGSTFYRWHIASSGAVTWGTTATATSSLAISFQADYLAEG